MTIQVTISSIVGTSPYDLYVCQVDGTDCFYIDRLTSEQLPYVFDIPAPYNNSESYLFKVVDDYGSISTGTTYLYASPTPTATVTPTITPTPSITATVTITPTPSVSQTSGAIPSPTTTQTLTPTPTETIGVTPTATETPTPSPTPDNIFNVTNSGASAYIINGASNPTLNLSEGQTYTFNIAATGHPFWIKTTPVTGTGNAYNNGVTNNGIANGTITFTVPYDAPSTLYYICQIHGVMQGQINIIDVPTPSPTTTETPTTTPTITQTPTPTQTPNETPNQTPTNTETPTQTPTNTPSNTPTETPTNTPTNNPSQTPTNTPTLTQTPTVTPSGCSGDIVNNQTWFTSPVSIFQPSMGSYSWARNNSNPTLVTELGITTIPYSNTGLNFQAFFDSLSQSDVIRIYNTPDPSTGYVNYEITNAGVFYSGGVTSYVFEVSLKENNNWDNNITYVQTKINFFNSEDVQYNCYIEIPTPTPTTTSTSTPTPTVTETPTQTPTITPTSSPVLPTEFDIVVEQIGSDVVWSGSGAFDFTSFSKISSSSGLQGSSTPQLGAFAVAPVGFSSYDQWGGTFTSFPNSFGSGTYTVTSSSTGSLFGVSYLNASNRRIIVPENYVSGTIISGTMTFSNTTLSSLGYTSGTYTFEWGTQGNISIINLTILPAPTPTPTPTVTTTQTPSITPTISQTPSNTPTNSQTPSNTPTNSVTPTISLTPSITQSPPPPPILEFFVQTPTGYTTADFSVNGTFYNSTGGNAVTFTNGNNYNGLTLYLNPYDNSGNLVSGSTNNPSLVNKLVTLRDTVDESNFITMNLQSISTAFLAENPILYVVWRIVGPQTFSSIYWNGQMYEGRVYKLSVAP
jgi:hypothetical protein